MISVDFHTYNNPIKKVTKRRFKGNTLVVGIYTDKGNLHIYFSSDAYCDFVGRLADAPMEVINE